MKKIITGTNFAIVLALTACSSRQPKNYQDSTANAMPNTDTTARPADTVKAQPDTAVKRDSVK